MRGPNPQVPIPLRCPLLPLFGIGSDSHGQARAFSQWTQPYPMMGKSKVVLFKFYLSLKMFIFESKGLKRVTQERED